MMRLISQYRQGNDLRWSLSTGPLPEYQADVNRSVSAQNEVMGDKTKRLPTSTNGGVCFALSVMWITKNGAGENFWTWLGAARKASPDRGIGENASVGEVFDTIQTLSKRQKQVTSEFVGQGIVPTPIHDLAQATIEARSPLRLVSPLGVKIFELLNYADKPGYYLFSISGAPQDGGYFEHAVAGRVGLGSPAVLFDANLGECELEPPETLLTLVDRLCTKGYHLQRRYKVWYSQFA